jgi:hypothetical protein
MMALNVRVRETMQALSLGWYEGKTIIDKPYEV